jgi:predicted transposase YdaD
MGLSEKGGRKEGREEGRKGGRKEGREEGYVPRSFILSFVHVTRKLNDFPLFQIKT